MSKLKTVLRGLRQTLIILLITLVLAEAAFRVYNYFRPSFIFYDDSYNRFRGKPNSPDFDFKLNSKGFKDVEFNIKKDDGTYRIVGLGDSFAFSVVPYRDAYLTLLEDGLNQSGKKTELINMGIAGTGPKDYLALLVNEGLQLNPDMVLVSFFIGNDFIEEKAEERPLYTYSYVASLINYLFLVNKGYEGQTLHANMEYSDTAPTFTDAKFVGIESDRSEIYHKQSKQAEKDFDAAVNYLMQIKQRCDERRMALAVVLIPDEVQVNRALQARVLQVKAFNSSAGEFDFTLPNQRLRTRLQAVGIRFIDLLDDFVAATNEKPLYKPNDTHWNIAGNKLAAEIIQKRLFSNATAPTEPGAPPNQLASPNAEPLPYEGFHDETDCRSIKGWVWDTLHPNEPVKVELYDGDTLIATVLANRFRKDLLEAKKGNGLHAFDYPVPPKLKDNKPHAIRVKVAGTTYTLTHSPKAIQCPLQ